MAPHPRRPPTTPFFPRGTAPPRLLFLPLAATSLPSARSHLPPLPSSAGSKSGGSLPEPHGLRVSVARRARTSGPLPPLPHCAARSPAVLSSPGPFHRRRCRHGGSVLRQQGLRVQRKEFKPTVSLLSSSHCLRRSRTPTTRADLRYRQPWRCAVICTGRWCLGDVSKCSRNMS